jgi:hypothetical protein
MEKLRSFDQNIGDVVRVGQYDHPGRTSAELCDGAVIAASIYQKLQKVLSHLI